MPSPFPIDRPLAPDEFKGRSEIIQHVCGRLTQTFQSTFLVGGPKTGQTSLLRYMTSQEARNRYTSLARSRNVYFDGGAIGQTMSPTQFWAGCLRELRGQVPAGTLQTLLDGMIQKARNGNIDLYDLEDTFDTFAREDFAVALFIGDFDNLLKNDKFWPPHDFFHIVRSLGQRQPRGLAFVVGIPRPMLDLWDASKRASPFYNIFASVHIGQLKEEEIRKIVREGFSDAGLSSDQSVEDLIIAASRGHPNLVNYIASLCAEMRKNGTSISQSALSKRFGETGGPVATLIMEMRRHLSTYERQLVDRMRTGSGQVTDAQKGTLYNLLQYGLLPPGTPIQ